MNRIVHLSARTLKIALIAVPMLLYGIYLAVIAADRYVSEAVIAVRQDGGEASALPGAAMLLAGIGSGSSQDTLHVREFVHSQDLLLRLEAKLKLREHFAGAGADLPYRLWAKESLEDFVRYYRARVQVLYDDRSSLLRRRPCCYRPPSHLDISYDTISDDRTQPVSIAVRHSIACTIGRVLMPQTNILLEGRLKAD